MSTRVRVTTSILVLMSTVAAMPATCHGDTLHYDLDGIVGQHQFFSFPSFELGLGRQFAHIDSVTISFAGGSYLQSSQGSYLDYSVGVALSIYQGPEIGWKSIGAAAQNLWASSSIDVTSTLPNEDLFSEFMTLMCDQPVECCSFMQANDGSTANYGYWEITSASLDVTGTPVPEPCPPFCLTSGLAALLLACRRHRWSNRLRGTQCRGE